MERYSNHGIALKYEELEALSDCYRSMQGTNGCNVTILEVAKELNNFAVSHPEIARRDRICEFIRSLTSQQ